MTRTEGAEYRNANLWVAAALGGKPTDPQGWRAKPQQSPPVARLARGLRAPDRRSLGEACAGGVANLFSALFLVAGWSYGFVELGMSGYVAGLAFIVPALLINALLRAALGLLMSLGKAGAIAVLAGGLNGLGALWLQGGLSF